MEDSLLAASSLPVLQEMKWRWDSQEGTWVGVGGLELKGGVENFPCDVHIDP